MNYNNKGKPFRLCLLIITLFWSSFFYGQSSSFGDIYVPSGGEFTLHNIDHSFLLGSSASQPGKIVTDRTGSKGYASFLGKASWSEASDERHIDGYARSYKTGEFIFPIGDKGRYRPAGVKSATEAQPADAAYYADNPSIIGITKASTIKNLSPIEYWDINGTSATSITLSWASSSGIAALTESNLTMLTIVGWNGLEWVEIPSTIDATSIIGGGASTLTSGSITSTSIIPEKLEFYTLASKVKIVIPDDITIKDSSRVVLGPAAVPDTNVTFSLSGPFNGSGKATIDPSTGLIDFKPSNNSFVGRDTIYKIRCVKNGSITLCDTTKIALVGRPNRTPILDTTELNRDKLLANLPPITTGGKPFTTSTTSSVGSVVTVDADGKVNYTPRLDFLGTDTVRIRRCVGDICDVVTYIILVKPSTLAVLPNYFSPNGDGINDIWNLDALLDVYPKTKVLIYNRWGNIVWRSTGPYGRSISGNNVWSGQQEGSQDLVPDGVYYYLIELEDEFKTSKTGFIELIRQ
jgi:gliding motility-associated-like protein